MHHPHLQTEYTGILGEYLVYWHPHGTHTQKHTPHTCVCVRVARGGGDGQRHAWNLNSSEHTEPVTGLPCDPLLKLHAAQLESCPITNSVLHQQP
jgi:hypothetical protein